MKSDKADLGSSPPTAESLAEAASAVVPANEFGETPEQEAFCDRNCCWSGHHPDCVRARLKEREHG